MGGNRGEGGGEILNASAGCINFARMGEMIVTADHLNVVHFNWLALRARTCGR